MKNYSRKNDETGGIGKGLAALIVLIMLAFATCFALADDDDENSMGRATVVSQQLSEEI